ncbi:hypothetical protein [Salinibacillus kushneri]|nr:hypothetical protein [Salinibacillus kushneri]
MNQISRLLKINNGLNIVIIIMTIIHHFMIKNSIDSGNNQGNNDG